jgi:PadR family transcriptional regulator, regulatory protein PadR
LTRQEGTHSVVEGRGEDGGNFGFVAGDAGSADLRTLALESMHGWRIAQRIQQVSKNALQIGQGSLYPALHRLEQKGWIRADWGPRRIIGGLSFYSLTATGRAQLKAELKDWERLTTAIGLVLKQV